MEFKVLITTIKNPKGAWLSLPSRIIVKQVKRWSDAGEAPIIREVSCDLELGKLENSSIKELNDIAEGLAKLPEALIGNLPLLLNHESLEEIINNNGANFRFYEGTTLEEVAEELVDSGKIEEFWTNDELHDYLDYQALGRDLPQFHPFFEGLDGGYVEYNK